MGAFVCLFLATLSFSAQALECHLDSVQGITEEVEDFGSIRIPMDLPVGARLWTSKQITRTMVCWAPPNAMSDEGIYLYPNPDQIALPPGISFGLIYNGKDEGKFGEKIYSGNRVPGGWKPSEGPRTSTFSIRYQVYLERTGPIGDIERLNLDMPIFQLDGVYGVNKERGKNYRYTLKGTMDEIQCSVSLTLPQSINFGSMTTWEGPGNNTPVASQSFSIGVSKRNCGTVNTDFSLNAIFDTRTNDASLPNNTQPPGTVSTMMDLGNGLGMTLQDSDGRAVSFNTPQPFVNMAGITDTTKRYTATLVAKGEAKEGPFNRPLILLVNYL
ncbi:fimbrial protein [Serratia aquatilis]